MTIHKTKFLLSYFIFAISLIYAQDILVLHDKVGATIDLQEKIFFGLFPDTENFLNAQFIDIPSGGVYVKIECFLNYGRSDTKKEIYSHYQFEQLSDEIGRHSPFTEAERNKLNKKKLPVYQKYLISQLPMNSMCRVKLYNGNVINGVYKDHKKENLRFWQNKELFSIPQQSIKNIRYYQKYERNPNITWGTIIGCGIVGMATGKMLVNILGWKQNKHLVMEYGGMPAGCYFGYLIYPKVNDFFMPEVVIDLEKNIKRLDTLTHLSYNFKKMREKWKKKE